MAASAIVDSQIKNRVGDGWRNAIIGVSPAPADAWSGRSNRTTSMRDVSELGTR